MAQSSKERVYAAAERIGADRAPTVTAVREEAGVSMADASRFLRQWKDEAAAATAAVGAAPGVLTDQAQKLAGSIWAEAVAMAGEDYRAAQAVWEAEKKALGQEIEELVTAADGAEAAHRAALEAAEAARAEAAGRAEHAVQDAQTVRGELETVRGQNAGLREQLAAAQASASSVQTAMDAVLARITTPQPPENVGSDHGEKA